MSWNVQKHRTDVWNIGKSVGISRIERGKKINLVRLTRITIIIIRLGDVWKGGRDVEAASEKQTERFRCGDPCGTAEPGYPWLAGYRYRAASLLIPALRARFVAFIGPEARLQPASDRGVPPASRGLFMEMEQIRNKTRYSFTNRVKNTLLTSPRLYYPETGERID